jgi:TolA-binding protein
MHLPRWAFASVGLALVACGGSAGDLAPSTSVDDPEPVPSAAAHARVAPPPTGPAEASDDPVPRLIAAMRDPRRSRLQPRALALVVTEIQQLEALKNVTDPSSPDHPMLLRRLAEDYAELEIAGASDPRKVEAARAGAIRAYRELVTTHGATYPLLDEVRYFLAWEYELGGDLANARRSYFELITQSPASKYVPLAYFAFGEAFFHEAATDPSKLELAKQAYLKVVTFPPPDSRAFGWAWIRLGQVADRQADREGATTAYHRAEDFARLYPQLPGAPSLTVAIPSWVDGVAAPTSR